MEGGVAGCMAGTSAVHWGCPPKGHGWPHAGNWTQVSISTPLVFPTAITPCLPSPTLTLPSAQAARRMFSLSSAQQASYRPSAVSKAAVSMSPPGVI